MVLLCLTDCSLTSAPFMVVFVQLSSFYSSQCYRPLIKQMYKEAQLLNRLLVRWMEVANYNKRKRRRKKKNFILLGTSTFPFCCSSQRAGGTNGFLSVSLGSGGQFVSIKQDKTSFYFVGFSHSLTCANHRL